MGGGGGKEMMRGESGDCESGGRTYNHCLRFGDIGL